MIKIKKVREDNVPYEKNTEVEEDVISKKIRLKLFNYMYYFYY